jgi:hypothetical protein
MAHLKQKVPDYYPALTPRQHRHQRLVEPRGLPVEIGFATLPNAGTAASHKPSADESLFCDFALFACMDAHVFDGRMQQIGSHDPMLRQSAFTILP